MPPGRVIARPWGTTSPSLGDSAAGGRKRLERLPARRDTELSQQALHVRPDGVFGDEEPLGDLVRAQMFVEQQQHLELTRRKRRRDRVGNAGVPAAAFS